MGKHEFQFGFQFRYEQINKSVDAAGRALQLSTPWRLRCIDPASAAVIRSPPQFTGHNLANMYLGVANYTTQFRRPWYYMRRQEYAPYFQDNWKITPRLTLNLGLRYEFRTPLYDRQNTQLSFGPEKRAYVLGTDLDRFIQARRDAAVDRARASRSTAARSSRYKEAGLPQALVHNNWKNFGPRLGFAYRALDGARSFVVRGGYRISYYPQPMSAVVRQHADHSDPRGHELPEQRDQYGALAGRSAELRPAHRAAVIAGVNTPDSIIDINDTRSLPRGFDGVLPRSEPAGCQGPRLELHDRERDHARTPCCAWPMSATTRSISSS